MMYDITGAADHAGITAQTIRRWERAGILPPPKRQRYGRMKAVYSEEDVSLIRSIKCSWSDPVTGATGSDEIKTKTGATDSSPPIIKQTIPSVATRAKPPEKPEQPLNQFSLERIEA